jgi:hypothetical protein
VANDVVHDGLEARVERLEREVDTNLRPTVHRLGNDLTGFKAVVEFQGKRSEPLPNGNGTVKWDMLKLIVVTAVASGTMAVGVTLWILHIAGKL